MQTHSRAFASALHEHPISSSCTEKCSVYPHVIGCYESWLETCGRGVCNTLPRYIGSTRYVITLYNQLSIINMLNGYSLMYLIVIRIKKFWYSGSFCIDFRQRRNTIFCVLWLIYRFFLRKFCKKKQWKLWNVNRNEYDMCMVFM